MLSLLPGEVVALMVLYLADYRDFRQLLWHCRAGGSILARVQSLDVAGVYSREGSGGNPFDYSRFPALRRVSVRLNFLLPHCIYDFMQLSSSVQYLDLLIPHILSIPRLRVLMEFLENDLSEEVQHVGIHLDHWDLFWDLHHPGEHVALMNRRRGAFANYILMLNNHSTLHSWALSIAGEPYTIQWACQQLGIPLPLAGP